MKIELSQHELITILHSLENSASNGGSDFLTICQYVDLQRKFNSLKNFLSKMEGDMSVFEKHPEIAISITYKKSPTLKGDKNDNRRSK